MDEKVQHDGYENTYTLVCNGCKKEILTLNESEETLPILTQVEVTSKKEEIVNDESIMQEVTELILDQLGEEHEEVVEASKESAFEFS